MSVYMVVANDMATAWLMELLWSSSSVLSVSVAEAACTC